MQISGSLPRLQFIGSSGRPRTCISGEFQGWRCCGSEPNSENHCVRKLATAARVAWSLRAEFHLQKHHSSLSKDIKIHLATRVPNSPARVNASSHLQGLH